jgi:hypothetical protein
MQRAEIGHQRIRINSRGICHGKTGGIEKNLVADIMEIAEDSSLAPVRVHRSSKIESNSSVSISCAGICSPFVVFVFTVRGRDSIGESGMRVVEDAGAPDKVRCRDRPR